MGMRLGCIPRASSRFVWSGRRVSDAGEVPGHRTICEFRRRHLKGVKQVFVSVVRPMAFGLAERDPGL